MVLKVHFTRLIGLLLAAGVVAFFACRTLPPKETSAEVVRLMGPGTVNGAELKQGMRVAAGDRIALGNGAEAVLRFGDRAVTRLKEADVTVDETRGRIVLRAERGSFMNFVRPGNKFSLKTPVAAASVRGTAFFVNVVSPTDSYICLCRGALRVDGEGLERDLQSSAHSAVNASRGPSGVAASTDTLKFHSDEDVRFVENQLPAR